MFRAEGVSLTCSVDRTGRRRWWLTRESGYTGARGSGEGGGAVEEHATGYVVVTAEQTAVAFRLDKVAMEAVVSGCVAALARALRRSSARVWWRMGRKWRETQREAARDVLLRAHLGAYMAGAGCKCTEAGVMCRLCAVVAPGVDALLLVDVGRVFPFGKSGWFAGGTAAIVGPRGERLLEERTGGDSSRGMECTDRECFVETLSGSLCRGSDRQSSKMCGGEPCPVV